MTFFRIAAVASAASAFAFAPPARAAIDAHETGRDVRIVVASDGSAVVDETAHVHLLANGWKGVDVPVEADAVPEPDASITSVDGGTFAANLTVVAPRMLHLDLLDKKVKKGDYAVHFRYRTSLVGNHEIVRDGALWRVSWTSPAMSEGIDSSRVVFDFPAAPTEPSVTEDAGFLVTLRRTVDRDELELVRLHVARGESITWSARIDPKAFSAVHDPVLRPPPPPRAKVTDDPLARVDGTWRIALAALFGIVFFATAVARARRFVAAKIDLKTALFVHPMIAAVMASAAYGVGVWLELTASPGGAAVAFAVASFAVILRIERKKNTPRGPGNWRAFSEERFLSRKDPRDIFDLGTSPGKIALASLVLVAAVLSITLQRVDDNAWLAVLPLALPWFAFWISGSLREPDASSSARHLRSVFLALRRARTRVVPWGRVPIGRRDMDDLRLLVVPPNALPGLVGIEVAIDWLGCAGGFTPRFELFVRARDASAAAEKMASLSRAARAVTGRRPEERVYVLEPRDATRASAIDLVLASARALVDRRVIGENGSRHDERRKPPLSENLPHAV